MTERAQTFLIYWGLLFMLIFGFVFWGLLHMLPPPPASLSAEAVAAFYTDNSLQIRIGAVICSWCSAFVMPIATVIAVQMRRVEHDGVPIWAILQFGGGIMMSIFLVLPPLFWGVAAFSPARAPEVTALMHELAMLTLTTTDQYFIFQFAAIAWVCLGRKQVPNSPFPRWMGYFTLWAAFMFELGAFAFIPKSGPFSWNGLFVFWFPFWVFGTWISVISVVMLRSIAAQRRAGDGAR